MRYALERIKNSFLVVLGIFTLFYVFIGMLSFAIYYKEKSNLNYSIFLDMFTLFILLFIVFYIIKFIYHLVSYKKEIKVSTNDFRYCSVAKALSKKQELFSDTYLDTSKMSFYNGEFDFIAPKLFNDSLYDTILNDKKANCLLLEQENIQKLFHTNKLSKSDYNRLHSLILNKKTDNNINIMFNLVNENTELYSNFKVKNSYDYEQPLDVFIDILYKNKKHWKEVIEDFNVTKTIDLNEIKSIEKRILEL